jgi:aldehyde:ferredoxin oxidoreductase
MARTSWINDESTPDLDAHVQQLEHFTQSLADGVVDATELATQEKNLVDAMKAVEASLSDDQHGKVTRLLAELTAYSVMRTLHEMAQVRVQNAIAPKA